MAPSSAKELEMMFSWALKRNGPVALRYPRGSAEEGGWPCPPVVEGRSIELRAGSDAGIIAVGNRAGAALGAAKELGGKKAGVLNLRFVKPLDEAGIRAFVRGKKAVLVVAEGSMQGGVGGEIRRLVQDSGYRGKIATVGLPDKFLEHGAPEELRARYGLDEKGLLERLTGMRG